MVNAGFNPLEEISRKTGKSIGELKNEMSKGAITSKMVQDAFISATSAGGKFFGMSAEGAKTLNGQISMLQESFDNMFNELGSKGEGVVMKAVQAGTFLIENYETIGKVIESMLIVYGTYKTALVLTTISQNGYTLAMRLARLQILSFQKAQALLNTTLLANPYAFVAAAVVGLCASIYLFTDRTSEAAKAQDNLNKIHEEAAKKATEEKTKIDLLVTAARNNKLSIDERRTAIQKLNNLIPSYNAQLDATTGKYRENKQALDEYLKSLVRKYELEGAKDKLIEIGKKKAELKLKLNKDLKDAERGGFSHDNDIVGGAFAAAVEGGVGAITHKQARIERKKVLVQQYKKSMQSIQAEEKLISSTYGNDLQKDAIGVTPTSKTGSHKALSEQKKENVYSASYDAEKIKKTKKTTKVKHDAVKEEHAKNEAQEKAFEIETKSKLENRRKIEDLTSETEQAEIDIMKDGNEKKIRQIELNRKKEQDAIDRAFEDIKQHRIEQAKQKWEANPSNKGKNFYNSSEYAYASSNDRYTEDEYKNYDAKTKAAWHKYDEEIAKLKNAEITYEDSLIKANESYFDKKTDLVKKYSKNVSDIYKAISEAEKRGDKDRVDALYRSLTEARANFGKEQMTLAFEQLKKDPNYIVAFDDLKGASTDTLNSLIGRFSEVKQAAGEALNPEGVKTYFDAINGMIDELISRDPIGMIKKLTDELLKQQDELKAAENRRDRIKGGEKIVKSIGYNKDLKKWVAEYWELADAEADVAAKGQQVAQTTHKIDTAEKRLLKSMQGVADKMGELGGKMGGQTGEIFSLFGSVMTYYQTISDGVVSVGQAGSKAMKAIESASAILAIISAAIQLMQTLSSILPNQDDLYEKAAQKQAEINKLRDSVNDYRLAVMKARHEESNWFSDSGLKGLQDAYEEHGRVAEAYYEKLNEAQEQYVNKSSGLKKALVPIVAGITAIAAVAAGVFTAGTGTVAIGALGSAVIGALTTTAVTATVATAAGVAVAGLAGAIVGKAIDAAVSSITYKDGQVAAKDNLRIQTQHKSFWRSQKTADLRQWVKEKYGKDLFDKDGMIDKELANEVLKNYGGKLQGETKQTLEKLVELREKYDEFNKSIHEYVSKLYSPLVNDMTESIWAWLKDGKDALSEFKDAASKTFANVAKDMLKQLLMKNVFKQYEEQLSDLYKAYAAGLIDEDGLSRGVEKIAGNMLNSVNSFIPVAQQFMKAVDSGMSKVGISLTKEGDSSQTATANGVTTITFEQASNIVALTTAGNISRDQIKERLSLMNATMDDIRALISQIGSSTPDYANSNRAIINNSYTPQIQVSFPKEELQNINGKIGTILAVVDEMRTHGAESLMEQKALSRDTEKIVMGNKEMLSCVNDFRRDFNKQY